MHKRYEYEYEYKCDCDYVFDCEQCMHNIHIQFALVIDNLRKLIRSICGRQAKQFN